MKVQSTQTSEDASSGCDDSNHSLAASEMREPLTTRYRVISRTSPDEVAHPDTFISGLILAPEDHAARRNARCVAFHAPQSRWYHLRGIRGSLVTAGDDSEFISRITTPASYHQPENDNKCKDDESAARKRTRGQRRARHSPPPPPLFSFLVSLLDL